MEYQVNTLPAKLEYLRLGCCPRNSKSLQYEDYISCVLNADKDISLSEKMPVLGASVAVTAYQLGLENGD